MIRRGDKVKTASGREGTVFTLHWDDGKAHSATVRFTDEPNYPVHDVVYQITQLTHAD